MLKHLHRHLHGHGPKMFLGVLALFLAFSLAVMLLWNAVMPDLLKAGSLDYLHAAGLLLLCRILFGGLGHGLWGSVALKGMREHFHAMSPAQREAFIRRMQERFPHHEHHHAHHEGFRRRHDGEDARRAREPHEADQAGAARDGA